MNRLNLEQNNPINIVVNLVERIRRQRRRLRISQEDLAIKSGVSFGSIKRFETKHEISLASFIKVCIALNLEDELINLFSSKRYTSIEDIIKEQENE